MENNPPVVPKEPDSPSTNSDFTQPQPSISASPATVAPEQSSAVPDSIIQPVSPPSTGPVVSSDIHVDGQPIPYSSPSQIPTIQKTSKHGMKLIVLSISLLVVIGLGVILATNQNLRATIFRQKFVSYTYNNGLGANQSFKLNFYRNSTIEQNNAGSGGGMVIVSPTLANNGLPIQVLIANGTNTNANELYNAESICGGYARTEFTVHINSANVDANVCGSGPENKVTNEFTTYKSGVVVYAITITQRYDTQRANTDQQYANQIVSKLGLNSYEGDIKTIIASIKPVKS